MTGREWGFRHDHGDGSIVPVGIKIYRWYAIARGVIDRVVVLREAYAA